MTDVAVFRATAAGVAAAVAARDAGARVTLVEPTPHVGGMVSGGLSWTDVGDARVLGGFVRRFYDAATYFPEPHVAESILGGLLDGIDVVPELPEAAVYVDAGYEGDLLAGRGVPFAVGRESRELYGERWAGRQPAYRPSKHNFDAILSPFRDDGSLLPHVVDDPEERLGEGDGALMAFGFRVCLTDRDPLPFERPDGYDPAEFELLDRWRAARPGRELMGLVPGLLPNGKCDVNSIGPFSLNLLDGSNRDYLDGDRAAVRAHHLEYTKRFLYHVSPPGWGLCADEFTDTGGWPHQLYVREGRRMLGAYVLTEHDLLQARPHDDVVALGSYNIDVREVVRTWRLLPEFTPTPAVFNEGYLSVPVPPYPIPYRCLTPRREDAADLLVPVALSASHVAYSSVRMEPTWMMLGTAAGLAAAQAARRGVAVQDVDVPQLQRQLRDEGQVLSL
ncbi:MAG TPA: FAD-dependent oxidoreductase [Gaiellaceae bacterium]|nr:FAD-dependent oxidoreductase [Gaiellaceae bacterium]